MLERRFKRLSHFSLSSMLPPLKVLAFKSWHLLILALATNFFFIFLPTFHILDWSLMLSFSFFMYALTCRCQSVVRELTVTFLDSGEVSNDFNFSQNFLLEQHK